MLWPRLSERILARRQEREGQTIVALHDPAGRSIRVVGVREWAVLSCADGTRDLAGIAAAVARHGIAIAPASIASFFGEIAELGWLVDGAPRELLAGRVESAHRTPPARAVVPMPGIRIACDGSGGCCRAYATVMFLPQDVHAAEAAVAQADDDGLRFLPLHGSAPTAARAVGLRDGACAYLDADGRCRIHARAGHSAKPLGCRWYPTNVVDDGSQLRVAPVIECACAAMPVAHGDPLVPAGIDRAADLPVGIAVERVPERVAIAEGIEVERAEAFALLDRIAAVACPGDAIGWLWSLADRLERVAMQADVAAVAAMPASVLAQACAPWARAAADRLGAETVWRSPDDAVCVRLRTVAAAAALLSSPTAAVALLAATPDDPALEDLVVRAGAWGRTWLTGAPLVDVLRTHAIAMALARAIPAFVPAAADGTLRRTPLAAVLAVRRTALGQL